MHLALILSIAQVEIAESIRIFLTPLLAEDEVDHGEQSVLPKMIDEMCPNVLIEDM